MAGVDLLPTLRDETAKDGAPVVLCWCGKTCPDCEDGSVLLCWCEKPRSQKRDLGHPGFVAGFDHDESFFD